MGMRPMKPHGLLLERPEKGIEVSQRNWTIDPIITLISYFDF